MDIERWVSSSDRRFSSETPKMGILNDAGYANGERKCRGSENSLILESFRSQRPRHSRSEHRLSLAARKDDLLIET